MNCTVLIDWRLVVALGVACSMVILTEKLSVADAATVSIHAIDAAKECVAID